MAKTNIFPLVPQDPTETLTLDIADDATAKTHDEYSIVSAELLINAAGADAQPTHTVPVAAEFGQIVHIDVTSLNKDTDTAAGIVKLTYGDSTLTFDAAGEEATVMFLENSVMDVGALFSGTATSSGVIS